MKLKAVHTVYEKLLMLIRITQSD